jgi:hypothetical protein
MLTRRNRKKFREGIERGEKKRDRKKERWNEGKRCEIKKLPGEKKKEIGGMERS